MKLSLQLAITSTPYTSSENAKLAASRMIAANRIIAANNRLNCI
jgi:hypothetical protein